MSTFSPTQWSLHPPDQPDHLAGAVMHSLSRPIGRHRPWGALLTLVVGGLTMGIAPLLIWPRRFGDFVLAEQRQLWHLVEWLRTRRHANDDGQTQALRDSIRDSGAPASLWAVPLTAVICLVVLWLGNPWPHPVFFTHWHHVYYNWRDPVPFSQGWSPQSICMAVASAGFPSHWFHVRAHMSDIRGVIARLNGVMAAQGMPAVRVGHVGLGLRPGWIIVAVLGFLGGAWWMVFMALAGAMHQRAVVQSQRTRWELAQLVHGVLQSQRPAMNVPTPFRLRRVCGNAMCARPAPGGASFCPRCGTRLS